MEEEPTGGVPGVRKMTAHVCAIALLLAGCGVAAGPAIVHAQGRWYAATGLRPEPGERAPIVLDAWGPFNCGGKTTTGCTWRTGQGEVIMIDIRRPADEIDRTATHEWGHHLGLTDGGPGIMGYKKSTPWSDCITQTELDTICLIYDCMWQRPECGQ